MEFEKIGALPIDGDKLRRAFPDLRPGTSAAVKDISIANGVSVAPYRKDLLAAPGESKSSGRGTSRVFIRQIGEILASDQISPSPE